MGQTGRAKWTEEAAKDKERFNQENAAYLAKKQTESLKVDIASPGEMRETSNKVEDEEASGGDMDAGDTLKTMEELPQEALAESEKVEVSEKKLERERLRSSLRKEAKGKPRSKVLALKGSVEQTSSVASSVGEIPPTVANYFAFLFSHWAGVRQVSSILFSVAQYYLQLTLAGASK